MTLCKCLPSMSFGDISTIKVMAFVARGVTYEALIAISVANLSEARLSFATKAVRDSSGHEKDVATSQGH